MVANGRVPAGREKVLLELAGLLGPALERGNGRVFYHLQYTHGLLAGRPLHADKPDAIKWRESEDEQGPGGSIGVPALTSEYERQQWRSPLRGR